MFLGIALAVACALVTNAGFLLCHRGAVAAPPVDGRHPLRSARDLFASRWWTIGWIGAVVAWLLHVGALSLVQLSVVQAVISGGLVFLAVFAERFFGFHLGRRQWIGLAVTATGLTVLGVTGGSPAHAARSSLAALIALEAGAFAASSLLVAGSIRLPRMHPGEGLVLAAAAGCLFGVSDISLKFLTHAATGGLMQALISPWTLAAVVASVVAFYSSARSLQIGPALAVIAFTSVAANLIAISGGILVFHDSVGAGASQIIGRMLAFCLVIAGAALMPAPTRARATTGEPASALPRPLGGLTRPADFIR
jgi:drug/metabolite transporter (DMT)-like permease